MRARRAVRLETLLRDGLAGLPARFVDGAELVRARRAEHPDDPCSAVELEGTLLGHPHLFVQGLRGTWLSLRATLAAATAPGFAERSPADPMADGA